MAFVSGVEFSRCSFSSSDSFGIFDVHDTEDADDDDDNSGHSPDDVDDDNSADVGLLGSFNSRPGHFLLHILLIKPFPTTNSVFEICSFSRN